MHRQVVTHHSICLTPKLLFPRRHASFVTTPALRYPSFCTPATGGPYEPILAVSRPIIPKHRPRHSGHRPAHTFCPGHTLLVGPQLATRPFQRTRKAHLAVAPHCQCHGATHELVFSSRSVGHRRTSRPGLSSTTSRPATCDDTRRCSRCLNPRLSRGHSATVPSAAACLPSPALHPAACPRWCQLDVRNVAAVLPVVTTGCAFRPCARGSFGPRHM